MKTKPPVIEKQLGKDLKTIEQLPAETRDLVALEAEAEKVTGQESADIHMKIRSKSRTTSSRRSGPGK
ncbi:MAG: hypothetical protein RL693_1237 [Verrucomicrobiota bacterium]|jgi:hypothetical protein